jgi:hypothetical protein
LAAGELTAARLGLQKADHKGLSMKSSGAFIDPHGGFRSLKSYQMSEIVYHARKRAGRRF